MVLTEKLIDKEAEDVKNKGMATGNEAMPRAMSLRHWNEPEWIFDELPKATIVSVLKPVTAVGDFSPMLLSYSIEMQYKQFKWRLLKKASQVLYLHFALKKRALLEEFHEKQEQVKEWLYSLGIVDQMAVVPDADEPDDGAVPVSSEERTKNRYVPSRAALSIISSSFGRQQTDSDREVAMQNYLNHFLGNLDIVNSREVCKFLEVSRLSFSSEYGQKLKEGYVAVRHLPKLASSGGELGCIPCQWFPCCSNNSWQKVWAVLKPGFLAFLEDPFDTEPVDIIVFDVLPISEDKESCPPDLASLDKGRNPLYYAVKVCCGNRCMTMRMTSSAKVSDWITSINDAAKSWCYPHRFASYAPQRGLTDDGSQAQWLIDGEAAFDAVASALENAKSEILMTGWWLCPELYLRRPFQKETSSRLDALLEAKAKQGIQIYILLYKEVSIALKINSMYSKKKLLNIHENVKVLRHPDHFSTGVYLWSHHEKLVIIDYRICFIGGLDLCFGRFDTTQHKVGDCPPSIWPGKDYYNPRESEPNSWEDTMTDELNRKKLPRMPWHDIHCAIWGPPCRDIARHFVQRWNHAKRNKAPNEETIPLLIPRHHMVLPHYMGKSNEIDIKSQITEGNGSRFDRDFSFESETPPENIPLLLPQEANREDDFSFGQKSKGEQMYHKDENRPTDGCKTSHAFQKLNVEDSTCETELNDSVDDADCTSGQNKSLHSVADSGMEVKEANLEIPDESEDHQANEHSQVGPRIACRCQVVRSACQWSAGTSQTEDSIHKAYFSLIENAEHFVYIENQFFISGFAGDETIQNRVVDALYKRILQAHKERTSFRVIVVLPLLPGFQGGIDDGGAATVRAIMHWQYRTISRENTSILHKLKALCGDKAHDYISFYGLRAYGRLAESAQVATSQVYVHSKLMIIDDRVACIGSSNINDRSLLGSRDSEIGIIIEDNEFIESTMNHEPWKAGKFTHSLRCSLWAEHLGLLPGEVDRIRDPMSEETFRHLWLTTAGANTKIYQDVFSCIPNDNIRSRAALRQSVAQMKEKVGHNTIDIGIAPSKVSVTKEDGVVEETDPTDRLSSVKGFLVNFPLEFMSQEDLRPLIIESEFYASPQVFH